MQPPSNPDGTNPTWTSVLKAFPSLGAHLGYRVGSELDDAVIERVGCNPNLQASWPSMQAKHDNDLCLTRILSSMRSGGCDINVLHTIRSMRMVFKLCPMRIFSLYASNCLQGRSYTLRSACKLRRCALEQGDLLQVP